MSRKVIDKIVTFLGSDWAELLENEFTRPYMQNLGEVIAEERKEYTIYPNTPAGVFSIFRNLPPYKIKVVIVGQD